MFDTVSTYLSQGKANGTDLLSQIPCYLSNVSETVFHSTGALTLSGNLKNYRVCVTRSGVKLTGSLGKYLHNDNIKLIDRLGAKEAITKLSDDLHLPIAKADVRRIDLAANFEMKYQVPFYFSLLGDTNNYDRLEQNNGLNYRMGVREMVFYSKLEEQLVKGLPIPPQLKDVNLLRYEFRLKNHILQQLGLSELQVSRLYDEKFYLELVERWKSEYNKIAKYKQQNLALTNILNVNQFEKQLLLLGVQSLGGEKEVLKLIAQAQMQGLFKHKMQVKRFKDKVKAICNSPQFSFESDAIKELNKKIMEI